VGYAVGVDMMQMLTCLCGLRGCCCDPQVRVVDVVQDGLGKGQTNTLARGVLPLTAAATQLLQGR